MQVKQHARQEVMCGIALGCTIVAAVDSFRQSARAMQSSLCLFDRRLRTCRRLSHSLQLRVLTPGHKPLHGDVHLLPCVLYLCKLLLGICCVTQVPCVAIR